MTDTPPAPDSAPTTARWLARLTLDGWRAMALVALVHVLAALLVFDPTPQATGDNGAYRALAEALATGRGYVRLWEPTHAPEVLYPPVFPLLLSFAWRLGATSWAALHVVMVAFSTLLAAASYVWIRRLLPAPHALLAALLVALSPALLDASHAVLSDIPFALFTGVALWAFTAAFRDDQSARSRSPWLLAAAIGGCIVAYFTRSAGLPLLVAALGWLVWRRRYVVAGALAAIILPLAVMWSARAKAAGGANYTDYLRFIDPYRPEAGRIDGIALVSRMGTNVSHYASQHLPDLLYGTHSGIAVFGGWIVLAIAATGYAARARRPQLAELWLPLYVGLLLLWPSAWSGDRLLLPAYPLILAYAVNGLSAVRALVPERALLGAAAIGVITLVVNDVALAKRGFSCTLAYRAGNPRPCVREGWQDFVDVARDLRGRLPAGSVVIARKPTILYAESGYPSLVYPLSQAPDTLFAAARAANARYMMVDASPLAELYVFNELRSHPSRFCSLPAFRKDLSSLLRIEPEGVASPGSTDTTTIRDCTPGGER